MLNTSRSCAGAAARQNHFGADYNLRRAEWEAAWAEARVPPADVPNLRARLAQIFGMAAAWGFVAEVRSPLLEAITLLMIRCQAPASAFP